MVLNFPTIFLIKVKPQYNEMVRDTKFHLVVYIVEMATFKVGINSR